MADEQPRESCVCAKRKLDVNLVSLRERSSLKDAAIRKDLDRFSIFRTRDHRARVLCCEESHDAAHTAMGIVLRNPVANRGLRLAGFASV